MAIPAKRFEFLNLETNIGVNDFITVKDSEIRNISEKDMPEIDKALEDMMPPLDQILKEDQDKIMESVKETMKEMAPDTELDKYDLKDMFRQTKDMVGLMGDTSKMPDKLMDGMLGGMFPGNAAAKNMAKSVFKVCGTMGSGLGSMRPFDVGIDCNGGSLKGSKGDCKPSGISGLLAALTGGALGKGFNELNALINAAVALATSAYKANICGGFSASTSGLNGNMSAIDRAGSMVMTGLSAVHGAKGMLDVINNTNSFNVGLQAPDSVKGLIGKPTMATNGYGNDGISKYMTQFGSDVRNVKNICTGITDGASLLNENWNKSSSGEMSLANVTDSDMFTIKANAGHAAITTNKLNNNPLSISSLNTINNDPMDSFNSAYVSLV